MLQYLFQRNKNEDIVPMEFEIRFIEIFRTVIENGWVL